MSSTNQVIYNNAAQAHDGSRYLATNTSAAGGGVYTDLAVPGGTSYVVTAWVRAQDVPAEMKAPILAVIDARMGEIYAGTFRRAANGLVEPIGSESVGLADKVVVPVREDWAVVGSGWLAYREALMQRLPREPLWSDGTRYPLARSIARLAAPQ